MLWEEVVLYSMSAGLVQLLDRYINDSLLSYFVLQSGYMLYDRVIRPAEVGVTQAAETKEDASE